MKRVFIGAVLMASTVIGAADFDIIKDNRPMTEIILPEKASEKLKADVKYFNESLEKSAKTGLLTVAKQTPDKNAIVFNVIPMKLADDDTFMIEFPDTKTMKVTCSERSSRWAVNYILQERAGILPLWKSETYYPKLADLSVPMQKVEKHASFNLRRDFANLYITELSEGGNAKSELGGTHGLPLDVFPAVKYAGNQSWPVEIMPVIGGKKLVLPPPKTGKPSDQLEWQYNKYWQPCWSNPRTVDIAVENILEILASEPNKKSVNMDVNDMAVYCECADCLKAVAGKKSMTGTEHRDYSELYWAWVNKVAEKVSAKYPDVYFTGIAYREVINPPSFKLHPNVVPTLCRDFYATVDPQIRKIMEDWISAWSQKASSIGYYDYAYGTLFYLIPRIYYKHQAEYIKYLYSQGMRVAFTECHANEPSEGPKLYLMMKLFWDVNLDPEKIINEWIVASVGADAAPYLRKYYRFWEDYWMGEDIRKTNWFESKGATYMRLEEKFGTHTFALKKGDMEKCRKLMEQVVIHAGTPEQKKRAEYLKMLFEMSDLAVTALFSEVIMPEGWLASAEDAVEMLKDVPSAVKAAEKLRDMPRARWLCQDGGMYENKQGVDLSPYLANNLSMVLPFMGNEKVKAAMQELAVNKDTPLLLRGQFKLWLGQSMNNLMVNGSFEALSPLPTGNVKIVQKHKYSGENSLMTSNGSLKWRIPVQPDKTYLFSVRIFIPENSAEGLFDIRLAPGENDKNITWLNQNPNRITAGQWNLFSSVITIPGAIRMIETANRLDIYLGFKNFEKDENVYIDDVMLACLDDIK